MIIAPNTVAAAIKKFMATDYFCNQIAPATRLSWSRYLIMAEHPDVLGALDVNEVRAKHATGLVADRLGRNAILIELNPQYADMIERRITDDAGMFAVFEPAERLRNEL
jgi:hypothetical protein